MTRVRPLMTSDIRVGRGVKDSPQMRLYRVGQGRQVKNGQKMWDVINGQSPVELGDKELIGQPKIVP